MDDIEIKIYLYAQDYNGLMELNINDVSFSLSEGINEIILMCSSNIVKITTYGKDMSKDTLVDNLKIIKDKHIRIKEMRIGGVRFMEHEVNDLLFDPYIGQNKSIEIDLPTKSNLVRWYLRKKENFYDNNPK